MIENILKIYLKNNIPYSKLQNEILKNFPRYNPRDIVNIYIDMETLIKPFLNSVVIPEYDSYSEEEIEFIILGLIINTAAHYRHYFFNKHNVSTNIYYFYSSKKCMCHLEYYKNYKKDFYNKYINVESSLSRMINKALDRFKKIVKYFSYVYFIDSLTHDKNIIPKYLHEEKNENVVHHFLLTNDQILFQYINQLKDFSIITLKGNSSERITKSNLLKVVSKLENVFDINHNMYENILTLIGCDKYNIDGIPKTKFGKVISILNKGITENLIRNEGYYNQEEFIQDISKIKNIKSIDLPKLINRNFKLMNLKYIYTKYFNKTILYQLVDEKLIDKYNYNLLKDINNMYFKHIPLSLDFLMEGSDYKF